MPHLTTKWGSGINLLLPTHSEIPLKVKGKPDYALNSHLKSTRFLLIFQIIFSTKGIYYWRQKKWMICIMQKFMAFFWFQLNVFSFRWHLHWVYNSLRLYSLHGTQFHSYYFKMCWGRRFCYVLTEASSQASSNRYAKNIFKKHKV